MHGTGLGTDLVPGWREKFLVGVGKLKLRLKPTLRFPRACEWHGLTIELLNSDQALAAGALLKLQEDPFDRLLTATSPGHSLLTPDPLIRQYPHVALDNVGCRGHP